MSHWFHRNPLKATAPVNSAFWFNDLRFCRIRLLDMLCDPNNDITNVWKEYEMYLSLFRGFLVAYDEKGGESKLRLLVRTKWTNSMLGSKPTVLNDAWFEVLHMTINVALWYTKHAAKLAAKDDVSEDEAKEIHRCLRKAAGLFDCASRESSRIKEEPEAGSDFDPRVLAAYVHTCTAEAQEITVARAIELKHSPSLISALSNETHKLFAQASDTLAQMDATIFDKWRKYLLLKSSFYLAYAYSFCAESLLAQDKCGEAIRAVKEGEKYMANAEDYVGLYGKAKGAGVHAKPENHLFFRQLKPLMKRTLEKCERENGFIYHQKVPDQIPELEGKAAFGLVKPDDFDLLSVNSPEVNFWTPAAYAAFDISREMPDFSKSKRLEEELPPVKEAPIYQTDKDPKNNSGCVLS